MEKLCYTWNQAISYLSQICSLPQYDEYEYWLALVMSRRQDIVDTLKQLKFDTYECEREIDFVVLRDWIGQCLHLMTLDQSKYVSSISSLYTLHSVFEAISYRTLGVTDIESFNQLNKPF